MLHPREYYLAFFLVFLSSYRRWKRSLIRARGVAMGKEHVGKGSTLLLVL